MIRSTIFALTLMAHGAVAQTLLKPVATTCVSSPFGNRYLAAHPEANGLHRGVDLPAPEGSPVWATAAGIVLRVQDKWPGGLEVLINHGTYISVYSHLASVSNRLIAGQTPITAGELVGYVGHTGQTYGSHLYFGIVHEGYPIDPAQVLGLPRCS
jgi:murein DD-endopeptidase MepM/ murein hydrolase activator NlpD